MSAKPTTPGLYLTFAPRPAAPSPLRSDVAAFIGHAKRGPLSMAVRVEGWRGYLREFGGLIEEADMPWAIRGYFENGGEVAYVVRLARTAAAAATGREPIASRTVWTVGELDAGGHWNSDAPAGGGFVTSRYRIEATSPGAWGDKTQVSIRYRFEGVKGRPELDLTIQAPDEPVEFFTQVGPPEVAEVVNQASALIRLVPIGPEPKAPPANSPPGPRRFIWNDMRLTGGTESSPPASLRSKYLEAVSLVVDEPEVALISLPDLYASADKSGLDEESAKEVLDELTTQIGSLHDRLAILDLPPDKQGVTAAIEWMTDFRHPRDPALLRNAAAYHPRLCIPNPPGGIAEPLRKLPPSGHVAGVISRLDRERGSHHTPANAEIFDAVDVVERVEVTEQGLLNEAGLNLLRCAPGRGLQVWGGRTADREPNGRFIAHRRLIHRLVRAIRRVAEPLVFDINGPELWLMLARTITTVLLEAWRAGALKGNRPDEAFRVQCDEKTNPPERQDLGQVVCEVDLAPATPMEFIHLRIALSGEGTLEVFES
jgi:hypothetical protein